MDDYLERRCVDTASLGEGCWLGLRDPWRQKWVWPLHAQYGDDTARVGTARSAKGLVQRALRWNEELALRTRPMGMAQNAGEQQLRFDLQPATAREYTRLEAAFRSANLQTRR